MITNIEKLFLPLHRRFKIPYGIIMFLILLITAAPQMGCTKTPDKTSPAAPIESQETKEVRQYQVLIVRSPGSLNFFGWKGEQDLKAAEIALYRLGIDYAYIDESELHKEDLPGKILLLPNTRCMNLEAIEGVKRFSQRGGKVFALYMSGYRDENNNLPVGTDNNFLLSDVYGVDFMTWDQNPARFAYIKDEEGEILQLGRNQVMLVRPREGTKVLAYWLDSQKKPETAGSLTLPAVIYNEQTGAIYCGEDLFAAENSQSPQVLAYIGRLFETLEKGTVTKEISPETAAFTPDFSVPQEVQQSVIPGGVLLTVGMGSETSDVYLHCKDEIKLSASHELYFIKKTKAGESYAENTQEITVKAEEMIYLMPVAVIGKDPYINIYDGGKNILARAFSSFAITSQKGNTPLSLVKLNSNSTYNYTSYRGSLILTPHAGGKINLKNRLTMNEYLAGVVPREMPASYPEEALKAMAVSARTFAMSNMNKHSSEGFNVCNTVHCQVYQGLMGERLTSNKAVSDTSCQVVLHQGKVTFTPFHAVCGGYGADVTSVWSSSSPVLTGGFDGKGGFEMDLSNETQFKQFIDNPPQCYCQQSGRFRWKQSFTHEEMKKNLDESVGVLMGRGSFDIGKVYSMEIKERAPDGRVQLIEIVASTGTYSFTKDKIRWLTSGGKIGTSGLPSTLFYLTADETGYTFAGGGWGHGVGMCQEGARGMAGQGMSYKEILLHYFRGASVEETED